MSKARNYTSGTEKALFLLSRGLCYAPNCAERVIRRVEGDDIVNVQIAHICAAERGGLRYDPTMDDDDRRHFSNLILLCTVHHKRVDSKITGKQYTAEDLQAWKQAREKGFSGYLEGLDGLTQESLEHLMVSAVTDVRDGITEAIDRVERVSQDAADMLRQLMSETYDRPYLDLDAVASLESSSRMLVNLPDHVYPLRIAVNALDGIEGYAAKLSNALDNVGQLQHYVGKIQEAKSELQDATYELERTSDAATESVEHVSRSLAAETTRLASAAASAASSSREASTTGYTVMETATRKEKWDYFRAGFATAVGLGIAITIFVIVLKNIPKTTGEAQTTAPATPSATTATQVVADDGARPKLKWAVTL